MPSPGRLAPHVSVVGESVVDFLPDGRGGHLARPGGSPANVARGLARLGRPVRLRTALGEDEPGRLLFASLTGDGVDVDPASRRPGASSTAVATLDALGQARYEFDVHWDCGPLALAPSTAWLHTGSIATVRPPGAAEVERLLARAVALDVPTSIDLNVREPLPWDHATAHRHLRRLAGHATVVKASTDDLALLAPGRDPVHAARDWLAGASTQLVVLTLGPRGAWASTGADDIEAAAPAVRLVDTVGAGDAFMAALIDGLLASPPEQRWEARRLTTTLRRACVAAAICCEREGADPPTQAELATRLP